jgi:glutaminase
MRPAAEQQVLEQNGGRVRVVELQGEISFAAGELISNVVLEDTDSVDFAILDFMAVRGVDPVVVPIISDLVDSIAGAGAQLVFSDSDRQPDFEQALNRLRESRGLPAVRRFPDLDMAIEWTEDELLDRYGNLTDDSEMPLSENGSTRGMDPGQVERLAEVLERREYPAGKRIYEAGEKVEEVLLITRGGINVLARDADGDVRRISTLPAGMVLGDIAMLGGGTRPGYAEAATDTVAYALSSDAWAGLRESDPALLSVFLENLIRLISLRAGHLRRHLFS